MGCEFPELPNLLVIAHWSLPQSCYRVADFSEARGGYRVGGDGEGKFASGEASLALSQAGASPRTP